MVAPTWNDELRTRTQLNLEIMRLAKEIGVSFAFPTQTIHVETLANHGESRPAHSGPTEREELAGLVDGFGPGGKLARPKHSEISKGYDCRRRWTETGTGDAEDGAGNGGEG
jgi:MscS family membrane protein